MLLLSTLFLDSWILKIVYGLHLSKSLHGLQKVRNLNKYFILDSWVLKIVYNLHLCKLLQGLQKVRNLNKGDFKLFGATGESIQAEAVGTRILKLPLRKVLKLKTYYYIPNIVRNIIPVPILLEQSFEIIAKNNNYSIYFSNEYNGSDLIDNGLIFLSLNDNVLHVNNMKKRKREDMNVTYL